MVLKIKELHDKCLILNIENGIYSIDIHGTKPEIINGKQFSTYEIETLETYESIDYTVEEVVDRLENIYKILS